MRNLCLAMGILIVFCGIAGATVNINIATKEELASLKGVSDKKAREIIDYRMKNGPFKKVEDLEKVPGITPAMMKQIRPQISTSGSSIIKTPVSKTSKTKRGGPNTAEPANADGLKSDKASKKTVEKWTTGRQTTEKKSK